MIRSATAFYLRTTLALALAACAAEAPRPPWISLFDGESDGWEATDFGGQGDVHVEDGALVLEMGQPLTGVTWPWPLPTSDYEIALEATRVDGTDFFCGLTFPVGDAHCSLILGGWGGSVAGLSCIDGLDASENDTTRYFAFVDGKPYAIRVRVTGEHIRAWLDDELIVDQPIAGRQIWLRPEVHLSRPLGIASYSTTAAVRAVRIRRL